MSISLLHYHLTVLRYSILRKLCALTSVSLKTFEQLCNCNGSRTYNNWLVSLNGWMLLSVLSGCGYKSCCSHLTFRYRACFEQGVRWHSGNYSVLIHSKGVYDMMIKRYRRMNSDNIKLFYTQVQSASLHFVVVYYSTQTQALKMFCKKAPS